MTALFRGRTTDFYLVSSGIWSCNLPVTGPTLSPLGYLPPQYDLYALAGWSSLHIRCQTHWLQVIYKSLLGKALPYLSSLVTITTPTCSTHSSGYISLVVPKANTSLAAFPSSSLLPLTGTNVKNHWNWRLITPSIILRISCQSSLPIAAAVHSPSINSPSNQLPTSSPYVFSSAL
jgi:hypothetical protein